MDFIKKYMSHEEYEVKKTPNVSLCLENNGTKHLHYTKKRFDDEYLTFEALESGTFTLTIGSGLTTGDVTSVSYSLDNGETWTTTNNVDGQKVTITTPTVNAGDEVLWKGSANRMANDTTTGSTSTFSSTANFNARGNIMSLLYSDEFKDKVNLSGKDYCFCYLFGNAKLINGKNISLPATTLSRNCYQTIFSNCTGLKTAPELPATTLTNYCYLNMFYGCTSLTIAPVLPATTLADNCYYSMFRGCTNLVTAPELPATTLTQSCYTSMFYGCTSLTTAPELPATILAQYCYYDMFNGCTNLTVAPELPATTLASQCYMSMFQGCTSLVNAPELPATTLAQSCYYQMFSNCRKLTTASELSATTLASSCYGYMFAGCTSLTTAPVLSATTLVNKCYERMFDGCTSLTVAPELPATTLAYQCYMNMFQGCTSLVNAPELPATTLTVSCYSQMFYGCRSLTTAPELPATTLAENCYGGMFAACTSLTTTPQLPATRLASDCYNNMFAGCRSLTTAPELSATTLASRCYNYMFLNCATLNNIKMLSVYQYYTTTYLSDWVKNVATYGKYTMSESSLQKYLQGNKDLRSFIPKGWEVWYVDSNGDEHYVGINDEGGSNPYGYDYSYDYSYGYGYNYGYDYDPLSGNRYPFDFYHDDDNTNTFRITNTGSTSISPDIYFIDSLENCMFGDYHYGLVYSYDGYIYSDVPYKSTCPTTITIEPNQTIYLKGIMKPYSHGFDIYISAQNVEIGGNILSIVDPQNMENSIYEGMYTKTDNVYRFDSFDTKYMTVKVLEDDAVITYYTDTPQNNVMYYSTNNGGSWSQLTTSVTFNAGTDVSLKMTYPTITPMSSGTHFGIGKFSFNKYVKVYGNVMSLIYGDDFSDRLSLTNLTEVFAGLFNGGGLTDASLLVLPATALSDNCYSGMFSDCTDLTTAPSILPATTLAEGCYSGMFSRCTSLTTAPELPATTLAEHCYEYMFNGCTSLTVAPELPTTTLTSYCYEYMFYGCTSLMTAPVLAAPTLVAYCYFHMFDGCTKLNSVTCLATSLIGSNSTYFWLNGVAATGTFTKAAVTNNWSISVNGIPNGWAVKNAT